MPRNPEIVQADLIPRGPTIHSAPATNFSDQELESAHGQGDIIIFSPDGSTPALFRVFSSQLRVLEELIIRSSIRASGGSNYGGSSDKEIGRGLNLRPQSAKNQLNVIFSTFGSVIHRTDRTHGIRYRERVLNFLVEKHLLQFAECYLVTSPSHPNPTVEAVPIIARAAHIDPEYRQDLAILLRTRRATLAERERALAVTRLSRRPAPETARKKENGPHHFMIWDPAEEKPMQVLRLSNREKISLFAPFVRPADNSGLEQKIKQIAPLKRPEARVLEQLVRHPDGDITKISTRLGVGSSEVSHWTRTLHEKLVIDQNITGETFVFILRYRGILVRQRPQKKTTLASLP